MPKSAAATAPIQPRADASVPSEAPHERIVAVARELFCRDGIHATGIDRILTAASASKMTLYARFGSKEALLREVLLREGEDWRTLFFAAVTGAGDAPRDRLGAAVRALPGWTEGEAFYGCAFMNAIAEHTKGEPWLRDLAREHHAAILRFLESQAREARCEEPAMLARQILLLIDGAIAALMVSGDPVVVQVAERTLAAVLDAALLNPATLAARPDAR